MYEDMEDAIDSLVEAIDYGRTDIVRTVVTTLQSDDYKDDEEISLEKVLNSLLTDEGTVLHYASKENQADIVRALLSARADPGVHNQDEKTPLDLVTDDKVKAVYNEELLQCVARSDIGRVCQLIAAGVDVNLKDSPISLNTPLHWAASYGNKEVVQCLCKRGSNVHAANTDGATPLHDAVKRGEPSVVEELLSVGAKADVKAVSGKYKGKTPFDIAAQKPEVLKIMRKYHTPLSNGDISNGPLNGMSDDTVNAAEDTSLATASPQPSVADLTTITEPTTPKGEARTVSEPQTPVTPITPHTTMNGPQPTLVMHEKQMSGDSPSTSAMSPPESLVTDTRLHLLWPRPQKLVQREGLAFRPEGTLSVYLIPGPNHRESIEAMTKLWNLHRPRLQTLGQQMHMETVASYVPLAAIHVLSEINRNLFTREESYRVSVRQHQIKLQASDKAGLHFGICTILQLLQLCKEDGVPSLQIHDHPCLSQRGVLLDMSKGRIQKLDALKNLIKTLSSLKINQLHIYSRCLIPDDPSVRWQFPLARSTLMELDAYSNEHMVTLVPVLDVSPKVTFEHLTELSPSFHQFITCFNHTSVVSVGPRLSGFLIDIAESGLLIDDTRRFLPLAPHHTVQLCAYLFHEYPESLLQLPPNMVLAEYGFQASQDFHKHAVMFSETGVPFCHVPGTGAWNSLAGCPEAAVSNIHSAVESAIAHGGLGVVLSHWSGVGHLTHFPLAYPGLITGAGLSWNQEIHLEYLHANLASLINGHVLRDTAEITGQVIIELGRAETYVLRCARNQAGTDTSDLPAERGTTLFQLLSNPDEVPLENLRSEVFQRAMRHIRKCQGELSKAALLCDEAPQVLSELQLTADLMLSACRIGRALVNAGKNPTASSGLNVVNMGIANLAPTAKTDLANRLLSQLETYRGVWLDRNLSHGLQESLLTFSSMLKPFVADGKTEEPWATHTPK